ncbi:putative acyl-CoA hydrolase [Medicago truncatula]|uniref:Acyl-coenzyme A thioesterase 13 n=1 Tax=Medicago truncatula TaxID=3880 RepID=G7J2N8_MEDTR|nr:acyl-coenzyme A thioesterase 13 [Medicago truncatula]AES72953.1 acyl-CoA thioesterase, putative [Medicago truncatula]AFK44404.1 unknown [Medicago truncatula]RHN70033.1 putative acyl-CoA hydrolase [Medicago truncatula]
MNLESVKRNLEKREGETTSTVNGLPLGFLQPLIMSSLRVDLIEPGRVICSMNIPPRLLNSGNSLHGGATAALVDVVGSAAIPASGYLGRNTGVSVEINVSYLDAAYAHEEIEIEAKALRVGKTLATISVEFRKKKTGRVFAQGRHTKYLPTASKL